MLLKFAVFGIKRKCLELKEKKLTILEEIRFVKSIDATSVHDILHYMIYTLYHRVIDLCAKILYLTLSKNNFFFLCKIKSLVPITSVPVNRLDQNPINCIVPESNAQGPSLYTTI